VSDTLKTLGLSPDDEEHPADSRVLKSLGLEPDKEEHPAARPKIGLRELEDWETTPGAKPPKRVYIYGTPPPEDLTTLEQVGEAIRPSNVIPKIAGNFASNTVEYAGPAAQIMAQGASDVMSGQPATGVGRFAMGALGTALSPVAGAMKTGVTDPLTYLTGNPDFAEKASMFVPMNTGSRAASSAIQAVRPSIRAADFVAQKAGDELPEVLARMRSNPRLRPIDTSDQLRMSGQGLVASAEDPEASRILTQSMRQSAAGARDAVKGTYNEAMGPPPNLFDEYQRLQQQARHIGRSQIAPPLITAGPVDTSSTIANIDKVLNPAAVKMTPGTTITATPLQQKLAELRQDIASGDKEVLTDASRLHDVQSQLRRDAEDLLASSSGSDRTLGRKLMDFRGKLVDNIDAAAPGYKKGLEAYRDQKDIERAFKFGQDVLKNTEDLKTDPSFLKQWVESKDRTPEEISAARLGARQAVERKMGSIKQSGLDPARSGTDVPQVEFNRQKLETLFGKENTDKMFKHLQDERDIALTNNRGLGNSKTAETEAARLELKPRDVSQPHSQLPTWALATGAGIGALTNPTLGTLAGGTLLAARGAKSGYDWLGRQGDISRNKSIAGILSRNDPETIARLMEARERISRRNKLQNLIAPP
jgi:hypothetical protein